MNGTVALVSRGALRHNIRMLRDRVAPAELLAVVKDDAYGHGVGPVVAELQREGVERFGTLELAPALSLKRHLPSAMVFAWVFDQGDELTPAVEAGVDLGITDAANLERAARAGTAVGQPARIHLKIDTGLHRAGALASGWPVFVQRAAALQRQGTVVVEGVWTHLAEASDDDDSRSLADYREAVAIAQEHGIAGVTRHVSASAASYFRADSRFDLVRIGAFLYGIAPGGGIGPAQLGLRPVMTLRSPIVSLAASGSRSVAMLGIGGTAGILSDAAGAASVSLGSDRYPVIGVEPGSMAIDVTGSAARVGDEVTLFGSSSEGEPTLQEWADGMGTIGEEIVTRLSAAVPRRYVA